MKQAKILFDKSLYAQVEKTLNKAEELCSKYEKYIYHMEIIRWRKKIVYSSSIFSKIEEEQISCLYKEEKRISELVDNQNEYWHLNGLMYFQYKTLGVARLEEDIEKYNFFKTHPNIINKELAKSYYAKLHFFWIHLHYCLVTANLNGDILLCKRTGRFYRSPPTPGRRKP